MLSFCTWRCAVDLYQIVNVYQHFIHETPLCSTFMICNYSAAHTFLLYHMKNVFVVSP